MGFDFALPTNTGREVGGVIEEVGRDVRALKVGDRVTVRSSVMVRVRIMQDSTDPRAIGSRASRTLRARTMTVATS